MYVNEGCLPESVTAFAAHFKVFLIKAFLVTLSLTYCPMLLSLHSCIKYWLEFFGNCYFSLMSVDGLLENNKAEIKILQARRECS